MIGCLAAQRTAPGALITFDGGSDTVAIIPIFADNNAASNGNSIAALPYATPVTAAAPVAGESVTLTPALSTSGFTLADAETLTNNKDSTDAGATLDFTAGASAGYTVSGSGTVVNGDEDYATVTLTDLTSNAVLYNYRVDQLQLGPGFYTLDSSGGPLCGVLTPGDEYAYVVDGQIGQGPASTETALATFGLTFAAVPEPTGIAALVSLAATVIGRRRRV